jgi:general secretion pathway protein A
MYLAHFRFTEAPFAITPDPRYLYMSERHREALAHLLYGIAEPGGFVQLTGEVGTGKTTVCRCLLEQLPPNADVALILNPRLRSHELLGTLCDELRIAYPPGTTSVKLLVDALSRHLLDTYARGRRTTVIIDEAQDLDTDVLEQVRLLTNLETSTEKLLRIILIGQPELVHTLSRPKLRQLAQRITARYHLTPLSKDETRAYVHHRLEVAGGSGDLFTPGAIRQVHRLSGGVPRLINVICDRALLGAYTQSQPGVDARTVRRAAVEVLGRAARLGRTRGLRRSTVALALVAAGIGTVLVLTPGVAKRIAGGPTRPEERAVIQPAGGLSRVSAPESRETREAEGLPRDHADGGSPTTAAEPLPTSKVSARFETSLGRGDAGDVAFGALLSDPAVRADKPSAFASLYARWRLDYPDTEGGLACDRERLRGLECVHRAGTWKKLRRLNVAAVLELVAPDGQRRYATVVALDKDDVTLELGGRPFTFPVSEIDPFWEGSFILLWPPPAPGAVTIVPGARGRPVEWVRKRLDQIDGRSERGGGRDVYDEELRTRVLAFQRSRAVTVDGIIGVETLTQLSAASHEAGIPWLSTPRP